MHQYITSFRCCLLLKQVDLEVIISAQFLYHFQHVTAGISATFVLAVCSFFLLKLSHVGYRHQLTSIGSNATINLSKYVLMHVRIQPLPINIPSSALIQPFRWPNLLIVLVTLPVILWKSPAWHILKTKGNTKTFHILLNTCGCYVSTVIKKSLSL